VADAAKILSLEDFLKLYPWSDEVPAGAKLEWLFHYDLEVDIAHLWPYLIDTSRLNRALGLSKMDFEERDGVLHGTSRAGGLFHEWVEKPWDWNFGRDLVVVRTYARGFAKYVRGIYVIEELDDDKIRVYVYFGWIPRNVLYGWAIKLGMGSIGVSYGETLRAIAADAPEGRPSVYEATAPALDLDQQGHLRQLRNRLVNGGQNADLIDRLVELVETGDDMDVDRIQPLKLARQWNVDSRELLATCLHATRAGMLELSWDIVCPLCRGTRMEVTELSGVPRDASCEVCEVAFETCEEHALEITFHAHPAVREVPKLFYCSAEPSTRQHIKLQLALAPGAHCDTPTRLEPGRYRMRTVGSDDFHYVDVTESEGEDNVDVEVTSLTDLRLRAQPTFRLSNGGTEPRIFVVEETTWADDALRPGNLFSFQEFRDLFSEDYISADVQLAVGQQSIFFSDIVGSTRFYAEAGDPGAFMKVRDHFAVLFDIVRENRGAVVKTIGDAVMAAFPSSVDAVRASEAVHLAFDGVKNDGIRLRISLNKRGSL
jgi:hypothetical protein